MSADADEPGDRDPHFVSWPTSLEHLIEMRRAVCAMERLAITMETHLGADDSYVHLLKAAIGVVDEIYENHSVLSEQSQIEQRLIADDREGTAS